MWKLFWFTLPEFVAAAISLALAPTGGAAGRLRGGRPVGGADHKTAIPRFGGLAVVVSIAAVIGSAGFLNGGRCRQLSC